MVIETPPLIIGAKYKLKEEKYNTYMCLEWTWLLFSSVL